MKDIEMSVKITDMCVGLTLYTVKKSSMGNRTWTFKVIELDEDHNLVLASVNNNLPTWFSQEMIDSIGPLYT